MKPSIRLLAASVLAVPVLLSACADPVEPAGSQDGAASGAWTDEPQTSAQGGEAGLVMDEPAADAEERLAGVLIQGVLRCDALDASPGFERELAFQAAGGGVFELRSGTPDEARYEFWRLEIENGRFMATGEYVEGSPELKTGNLSGVIYDGRLTGEGLRGPRTCQLDAVITD